MGGGSAASRREADRRRAAYLKSIGEERRTGRCPVCYGLVSLTAMTAHIDQHARGYVEKKKRAA